MKIQTAAAALAIILSAAFSAPAAEARVAHHKGSHAHSATLVKTSAKKTHKAKAKAKKKSAKKGHKKAA